MPTTEVDAGESRAEAPSGIHHETAFEEALRRTMARLQSRLRTRSPFLAGLLINWTVGLAAGEKPERYFTHPVAFPILLLPWWLEESLAGDVDRPFQADLMYSSVCAYYGIRLVDDVMDLRDAASTDLLPAAGLFQHEFQSTYYQHFPPRHPFWGQFDDAWARCAEATVRDARLSVNDAATFAEVCSMKVSAAMIPMIAVSLRHGCASLPPTWSQVFELFSRWHQFYNDFFDCKRDHDNGAHTLFLSEWRRRRIADEPLMSWVVREGFDWGLAQLLAWSGELALLAVETGSEPLQAYLRRRQALLLQTAQEVAPGMVVFRRLLLGSA